MLLQGILLGISLSFLIGPLLFAIVEAGIGQGFRAGLSVAAGIWVSDGLYVMAAFYGMGAMETLVALPHFKLWTGLLGGLMLIGFGLGSLYKSHKQHKSQLSDSLVLAQSSVQMQKTYLWWWLRGFLLNSVNPGTVIFWLGITSAVVVPSGWGHEQMRIFFGGMLATLILTDMLKAWAAKKLRRFLTPTHTRQIQRGIGLFLIIFGVVLALRVTIS